MKKNPHVLMLGWEFPPLFSGGLGIVTKNLMEALVEQGTDVTLLLPSFVTEQTDEAPKYTWSTVTKTVNFHEKVQKILNYKIVRVFSDQLMSPYLERNRYLAENLNRKELTVVSRPLGVETKHLSSHNISNNVFVQESKPKNQATKKLYGEDLFREIERFAAEALVATEHEHFDLVHAQDWITAEAALQLKFQRGIPFVFHVHATEYDRVGHDPEGSEVFRREQYAMQEAQHIIAVSHYTKKILQDVYGISAEKISVVHNAYTKKIPKKHPSERWHKDKSKFWVLFIGRITLQKGPDYFLEAAKKVMEVDNRVHFLIAGDGDMLPHVVETIAKEKLYTNVHCLGFLTPEDRDALYLFTDACVIPSVSEPFGLTAIEAVFHQSPLILSKTCGANEIIPHKLNTDYWDSEKMAEYIVALAKYPALRRTLRDKALAELPNITWSTQAELVQGIYEEILG